MAEINHGNREINRETGKKVEINRGMERKIDQKAGKKIGIDKGIEKKIDQEKDKEINREADKKMETDRETDKKRDRKTDQGTDNRADQGIDKEIDPREIETSEKGEDIENRAEGKKGVGNDERNLKEKIYDKIPISLKALDILIAVLISVFVFMMLYFALRKFL